MFQLNTLAPLCKKRKRIGRGGSRGGTSGRGHKGQNARSGGTSRVRPQFEGGQMPLVRRLPKRGFSNLIFKDIFHLVNLEDLETRFDSGALVTKETLFENGFLKGKKQLPLKILARGSITKKFIVHTNAISKTAAAAIEKLGGEVKLIKEGE
jgi:large subunit ribosomal protein L15